MKKLDINFTKLTYQNFYEDKILLMEYDMTPDEILNLKNRINKITINNKNYFLRLKYHKKCHHPVYKLEILFCVEPIRQYMMKNILDLGYIIQHLSSKSWSGPYDLILDHLKPTQIKHYLAYTHPILLTWEEITDKSYLNFIIKSTSEYLNEFFKKHLLKLKIDKKYCTCELDTYFNNDNIAKLNINFYKSVYENN